MGTVEYHKYIRFQKHDTFNRGVNITLTAFFYKRFISGVWKYIIILEIICSRNFYYATITHQKNQS